MYDDEPCIGSVVVFSDVAGYLYSARRTYTGWIWNPPAANAEKAFPWDDICMPGLVIEAVISPPAHTSDELVSHGRPMLKTKKRPAKGKKAPKPALAKAAPRISPESPVYFESPDELGVNIAVLAGGRTLTGVHSPERCAGDTCAIHAVTRHPLSEWPQEFDPATHSISRVCEHGIMHPDPDEAPWRRAVGRSEIHDCDGCCKEQYMLDAMKGWT